MTLPELLNIAPFSWQGLLSGLIAGSIIGAERQLAGKPVGIRTSSLICLSTYVFIALGESVVGAGVDRSRVLGQVVTGVGFLGAGVIMSREGIIKGVTSASAIWVLAAIGCTIGMGHDAAGIKIAVIGVIILTGVSLLESWIVALRRGVHSKIRPHKNDDAHHQGE
jgi:putative Mg2+ transporter-C (MgtC) family protein